MTSMGVLQLPWMGVKCVWLAGQSADGTQVDDIPECADCVVFSDLHVVPASSRTRFFNAGHFISKPHATCALHTTVHGCLHKRAKILVFHCTFAGYLEDSEASLICAVLHRLVQMKRKDGCVDSLLVIRSSICCKSWKEDAGVIVGNE
jgi:hypothetical protein